MNKPSEWSREFPKINGFYWMRDGHDLRIIELDRGQLWFAGVDSSYHEPEARGCEFLGPLSPSDTLKAGMFEELVESLTLIAEPKFETDESGHIRYYLKDKDVKTARHLLTRCREIEKEKS